MVKFVMRLSVIAILFYQCRANNSNCQFYPFYHVAPPYGWMNDPNGFSIFHGIYQLFFQFNPFSSQGPGIANWGHVRSGDLIYWEHLPIAMKPDEPYDKGGVFSGSAIAENNTLYLIYTGNVNHPGQNPNHTQRQALAYTSNGVTVTKYAGNPIIVGEKYQPNFRDPKVWKHNGTYYMVLGNSFNNNTLGRALLYKSKDLIHWKMASILAESNGTLGYMWECPDFFLLGGYWVLLFSPQGIKPEGDKYRNLYQAGYIIGFFDYVTLIFTPISPFKEIDHGHDFYATQTMLDTKKHDRRIMVAWCDMWGNVYPERKEGWTGQMTTIRVLTLISTPELAILQRPIEEMSIVRDKLLYHGMATSETRVKLSNNTAEILVKASKCEDFVLIIESENATVTISYSYANKTITLDRGGNDGIRRTKWMPKYIIKMRIFIDRSSVELFCGEGEVTFSSRSFPRSEITVRLGENSTASEFSVYSMKRTIPLPILSCNSTNSN